MVSPRSLLIGSSSRSAPKGDRSESLNEFRLISRCSPDQPQVIETAPHIHRSYLRLSNSVLFLLATPWGCVSYIFLCCRGFSGSPYTYQVEASLSTPFSLLFCRRASIEIAPLPHKNLGRPSNSKPPSHSKGRYNRPFLAAAQPF
jgi:hypothetical protein